VVPSIAAWAVSSGIGFSRGVARSAHDQHRFIALEEMAGTLPGERAWV
jgi:hypothetical protein